MKCPDCGSRLADVMFSQTDRAMRCFRCGGFWIDSATVNRMSGQKLTEWRRISIDPMWLQSGKGMCPLDNMMLTRYTGDIVPRNVTAMRCVRCGKWWFPGENLFALKPALDAKIGYLRAWGNISEISKIGLPVVLTIMLVGGIMAGVTLVKLRTQESVPAATVVRDVGVTFVAGKWAMVTMTAAADSVKVKYRLNQMRPVSRSDESKWWTEVTARCSQGKCQAIMTDIEYGKEYVLEVEGEGYEFVAK